MITPEPSAVTQPRCIAGIETVNLPDGNWRVRAVCSCGWRSGLFLTVMQAQAAAGDHDGSRS